MKLKDMLKIITHGEIIVFDQDSGLHTDGIPHWEMDHPQLRTLMDKTVTGIYAYPLADSGMKLAEFAIEVADEKL